MVGVPALALSGKLIAAGGLAIEGGIGMIGSSYDKIEVYKSEAANSSEAKLKEKAEALDDINVKSIENEVSNSGLTEPSLTKGGKLTEKEIEMLTSKDNVLGHKRELETAELFRAEGYDIKILEELKEGNGYGIKKNSNPDFLIENKVFDCYAPEASQPKNVIKEIGKKNKTQSERIVLNLDGYKGNIDDLKSNILRKTNGDLRRLKEVMVTKDGKITRWFIRGE